MGVGHRFEPDAAFGLRHPAGALEPADLVRSGSPTSQYRVGIGVPSSRNGALRITTGPPSGVADDDRELVPRAAGRAAGPPTPRHRP